MSPFVTPLDVFNHFLAHPMLRKRHLSAAMQELVSKAKRRHVGQWLFIRRKGPKLAGRKHTLHGKILDIDPGGDKIKVEYHSELGKHLEWFGLTEAHYYLVERKDNEQHPQIPAAILD